MENVKVVPPQSFPNPSFTRNKFYLFLVLGVLLFSALSSLMTYFIIKFSTTQPQPKEKETTEINWTTHSFGPYSFEYPSGWHVADFWTSSPIGKEGPVDYWIINTVISSKPITFSYGAANYTDITNTLTGGVLPGDIIIVDKYGSSNPDALLQKDIETYKKLLMELREEEFKTEVGTVYHFTGKVEWYGRTMPVEKYYLMIQSQDFPPEPGDNRIISAEIIDNPETSEILKRIVTSLTRIP